MKKFYPTVKYLTQNKFDSDFVEKFTSLSEGAQDWVLTKNLALCNYLKGPKECEYDKLDFGKDRITTKNIFLRVLPGKEMVCPIHKAELQKKNVVVNLNGKMKGMSLNTCITCKRLYSNEVPEDEELFKSLGVPYEIIVQEDYLNEKTF